VGRDKRCPYKIFNVFSSRFKWSLEPNRLARLLAEKRAAGAELLDLTQSNPTRVGLESNSREILDALTQPQSLVYEPAARGLTPAREAVSAYYDHRVDPRHIFLTASTSESYSFLFKLLADRGDNLLVPEPSYPLFEFLAGLEGIDLVPYRLDYPSWRIDFDSIEEAANAHTRAAIVVHPNNPTGSFAKREEADRLVDLCANRSWALIADEVFSDFGLTSDAQRAPSFAGVSGTLTFVLNGLSKSLALPQMKLGWMIAGGPEPILSQAEERLELIADTFLSVSAPVQWSVPVWLSLREQRQKEIVGRIKSNLEWLITTTANSACHVLPVEGGWSAVIEVPRLMTEEEQVLELLECDGVLVHPGYFFDFPREGFLVISLLPPPEIFREGVGRLIARLGN
jgi:aspartate/methionine/tyrosine aminotransferase